MIEVANFLKMYEAEGREVPPIDGRRAVPHALVDHSVGGRHAQNFGDRRL